MCGGSQYEDWVSGKIFYDGYEGGFVDWEEVIPILRENCFESDIDEYNKVIEKYGIGSEQAVEFVESKTLLYSYSKLCCEAEEVREYQSSNGETVVSIMYDREC